MITATSSSSGHCLCRNVRYRFEGPRTWACFCHCEGVPAKLCSAHRGLHRSPFRRLPLAGWLAGRNGARILPSQPRSQALLLQPMRNAHGFLGRTLSGRNSSLCRYPRKSSRFQAQLLCALPGKVIMASLGRFTPSLSWECSC